MRDEEGLGWKEITAEWCKLTGVTTAVGLSTLRMRYQTMKANFVGFTADDVFPPSPQSFLILRSR